VVIPVLKDSGVAESQFGQVVLAGASIADIVTLVLLSLFFSEKSSGLGAKLVLLGGFALLVLASAVTLARAGRSMRISRALLQLQDTSAQIRVRGAFVLLAIFVVLAEKFGLEAILGAFVAGAVLKLIDTDGAITHPQFRSKLEAAGFGIFVPFFFVTSGIRFDADALFASGSTLACRSFSLQRCFAQAERQPRKASSSSPSAPGGSAGTGNLPSSRIVVRICSR